jgi:hypothetical protein
MRRPPTVKLPCLAITKGLPAEASSCACTPAIARAETLASSRVVRLLDLLNLRMMERPFKK